MQPPSVPVLALSSTQSDAIQCNFFATWPGLTPDIVRRYLPPSDATVKGHLDQQRQRKHKHPSPDEQPIPSSGTRSHTIYAAILDPSAPLAAPTAASPAAFRSNQIAAPTTTS